MKLNILSLSKVLLLTVLIILSFSSTNSLKAQDGFFSDAQTLEPGIISGSLQPIIITNPNDFMMMFRGAYGLQSGLTLHGKLGTLADENYYGSHLEYRLISEAGNPATVAVIGGAYYYYDMGIKLGGVVSKRFSLFSLYSGLNVQPHFADETLTPMLLPFGVDIPLLNDQANFIMETNIGLNDDADAFEMLTFGVNYYF